MNITQVKEIFDSLNIETRIAFGGHRLIAARAGVPKFHVVPWSDDWDKEHPRRWEIYKMGKIGEDYKIQATVTDEFELQEWLINEYPTN